jgi:hypothetical protein
MFQAITTFFIFYCEGSNYCHVRNIVTDFPNSPEKVPHIASQDMFLILKRDEIPKEHL